MDSGGWKSKSRYWSACAGLLFLPHTQTYIELIVKCTHSFKMHAVTFKATIQCVVTKHTFAGMPYIEYIHLYSQSHVACELLTHWWHHQRPNSHDLPPLPRFDHCFSHLKPVRKGLLPLCELHFSRTHMDTHADLQGQHAITPQRSLSSLTSTLDIGGGTASKDDSVLSCSLVNLLLLSTASCDHRPVSHSGTNWRTEVVSFLPVHDLDWNLNTCAHEKKTKTLSTSQKSFKRAVLVIVSISTPSEIFVICHRGSSVRRQPDRLWLCQNCINVSDTLFSKTTDAVNGN